MDFENSIFLFGLFALIPLLAAFGIAVYWRRKTLQKFADQDFWTMLMPRRSASRKALRFTFSLLALAAIVVALANLRSGTKKEMVKRQGADIVLAIDVSRSMLAEDQKPNRLEVSRLFATKLIRQLQGSRVALVVFAGTANLQMPLSADARAAQLYVNLLNTDLASRQGTAIGDALDLSMRALDAGAGEEVSKSHQAIIMITDGETHDENSRQALESLNEQGIKLFTVGVGSPKGARIPNLINGRAVGHKKDKDGNIVLSKLNEPMLEQLALGADGRYFHISGGNQAVRDIMDEIDRLDHLESEEEYEFTEYKRHFQVFLGFALFFLLLDYLISDRKTGWLQKLKVFE
jgi:Ca-activated chloride channel family protein